VTRRRWLSFSSTLVLPGLNIYEGLKIDDQEKLKGRDYVFRARGRDLRGAIFDLASLPRVDFEGAELWGASFNHAQLQGASFNNAWLPWATFDSAQLQGASFERARVMGASFDSARLEGASLDSAFLQGAQLFHAHLEGASLEDIELPGASLEGAQLPGASLDGAQLQGASLDRAQLQGASLQRAVLSATLSATELTGALLWRTNLDALVLNDINFTDGPETWQPIWKDEDSTVHPWNGQAFQHLRMTIESLPLGDLRNKALDRIQRLDCANPDTKLVSCDPSVPTPQEAAAWREALEHASVNDAVYAKALAAELKELVCGERLYFEVSILRGLLKIALGAVWRDGRLAAADSETPALIDFNTSKNCPVSYSLTDADKDLLLLIKRDATKKPGG